MIVEKNEIVNVKLDKAIDRLVVNGTFIGDVEAKEIIVGKDGLLKGKVKYQSIRVKKGGRVDGEIGFLVEDKVE